jgi:hypothetical protein
MTEHDHGSSPQPAHCCPCTPRRVVEQGVSRRAFLGGTALGGVALTGLSWSLLSAAEGELESPAPRTPLKVKPILVYNVPKRRVQSSWRNWGGIETQAQADEEVVRIQGELDQLKATADFPVEFLPIAAVQGARELAEVQDVSTADTLLVFAAGGGTGDYNAIGNLKKDTILFVRHKSGPVYLWYEIISPRYLRQHTDTLKTVGIDDQDVVVDRMDEVQWRLRALCGLKNTIGSRIVAIGGLAGWAQPNDAIAKLVQERWKLDVRAVEYPQLAELIKAARADQAVVERSKRRAAEYLALPQTILETERAYVENAFVLEEVFRRLMKEADCQSITVNHCMGTIMPMSETTACMTLSTLNDAGFLAFCESDFVVIPSGILLARISGLPVFLNDPTYPHDGVITLAHCTAPRKMDGKTMEPTQIMTHFESDYGAAPKVDMHKGQVVTNIIPDFKAERWVGLTGEIVDHPLLPICRSQIDIRFTCDSLRLAERMPGFHWMTSYGNYLREIGYALKRVPIQWEVLS